MHRMTVAGALLTGLSALVLAAPAPVHEGPAAAGTVRCTEATGSVIKLTPQVTTRLTPGTQFKVEPTAAGCRMTGVQGRVFVRVASAPVALDAGPLHVEATRGEFMVAVDPNGQTDLKVFNGDARVTESQLIAGKDLRSRGIRRDKVSKRKDNTKGIGRVKPKPIAKAPAPPPPVTPPPVAPPPPSAFVGPPAPAVAPVAEFLPAVAGAGILGTIGGITGVVGGITGVVVAATSTPENTPVTVLAPASL